jgi:hypothetical protein
MCAVVVTGLAACGGGGKGSGTSTSAATQQQRLVTAMNAFARCARTHGVPVPDADPNGQIPGIDAIKNKYINTPQGHRVLTDCARQLRAARQLDDAAHSADRQPDLRFARCMRAHGVPLPDPTAKGDVGHVTVRINKESPQFQAAVGICERGRANGTGGQ